MGESTVSFWASERGIRLTMEISTSHPVFRFRVTTEASMERTSRMSGRRELLQRPVQSQSKSVISPRYSRMNGLIAMSLSRLIPQRHAA